MKKILLSLFAVSLYFAAEAQTKGLVTDQSGQPIDAVTITLSQNNKLISSIFADTGKFSLNAPKGSYTINATLVGYKPLTRQVDLPKDSFKLIMQADTKILGVVNITSSKPVIERKIDRTVFNVENSIVASGGSAWEALSKAPGVQAGSDGTLTANKKDVEVYMDGKPLHISGADLQTYLQGLPSSTIAAIEVYSTPPAGFDAEGGGVINIISKKSKANGFNISLNGGYTQASHASYTGSAVFNYRKDKLNVYGNYGYTDNQRERIQNDFETYVTPDSYSFWNGNLNYLDERHSHNYKLGADYQLTDKQ